MELDKDTFLKGICTGRALKAWRAGISGGALPTAIGADGTATGGSFDKGAFLSGLAVGRALHGWGLGKTVTPQGGEVADTGEILDSWEVIVANQGAPYAVGNWKWLDVGVVDGVDYGSTRMQKVYEGEDVSTSSWVAIDLLKRVRCLAPEELPYGGWADTELRAWLNSSLLAALPAVVQSGIATVTKYSYTADASWNMYDEETQDKLWIPSLQEIFGVQYEGGDPTLPNTETHCVQYAEIYYDAASRCKDVLTEQDDPDAIRRERISWWTRTRAARSSKWHEWNKVFCTLGSYEDDSVNAPQRFGIVLGFCL